jgi:hypothetical protein
MTFADKAYQGAGGSTRTPPKPRRHRPRLSRRQKTVNQHQAKVRAVGERAVATLKGAEILAKLRCRPRRATAIKPLDPRGGAHRHRGPDQLITTMSIGIGATRGQAPRRDRLLYGGAVAGTDWAVVVAGLGGTVLGRCCNGCRPQTRGGGIAGAKPPRGPGRTDGRGQTSGSRSTWTPSPPSTS